VNRVVPAGESVLDATRALAKRMTRNAPLALRHALMAVDQGLEIDLEKGLLVEATLFGILCGTDDLREGMNAFLEKRPAKFEGK
jgi:enoyl-CoA hydratase